MTGRAAPAGPEATGIFRQAAPANAPAVRRRTSTGRCGLCPRNAAKRPSTAAGVARAASQDDHVAGLAALTGANEAHDWVIRDPATVRCAANEFLDTIELVCQPCSVMGDANLIGDARHVDGHGNRLSCRCPVGFTQTAEECVDDALTDGTCGSLSCKACNASLGWTTSLSDSSACTTGETSCAANQRLVERDASGNVTGLPRARAARSSLIDTHVRAVLGVPLRTPDVPRCRHGRSSAEKACTCAGARVASPPSDDRIDALQHDDTIAVYPESAANIRYSNVQAKHNGDALMWTSRLDARPAPLR